MLFFAVPPAALVINLACVLGIRAAMSSCPGDYNNGSNNEDESFQPPVREVPCIDSSGTCVCHCRDVSGTLVSGSEKSWNTFLKAAEIRKDSIWNALQVLGSSTEKRDNCRYHRACYQHYTSKTLLERISQHRGQHDSATYKRDT